MKKQVKILSLFTFLFIYVVIPKSVLAVNDSSETHCSCSYAPGGSDASVSFTVDSVNTSNSNTGQKRKENCIPGRDKDCTVTTSTTSVRDISGTWGGTLSNFTTPNNNLSGDGKLAVGQCPTLVVLRKLTKKNGQVKPYLYLYNNDTAQGGAQWSGTQGCDRATDILGWYNVNAYDCSDFSSIILQCQKEYERTNGEEKSQEEIKKDNATNSDTYNKYVDSSGNAKYIPSGKEKKPPEFGEPEHQTCETVFGKSSDKKSVAWILQTLFNYIKLIGVLLALIFSGIDFTKVILANDADAMKKAQKKLSFRSGAIIALLILPTIINILLGLFISGSFDISCSIK